ncbi:MAG: hypothetical protein ABIL00_02190 [candidate division WOR-3 bacterium]
MGQKRGGGREEETGRGNRRERRGGRVGKIREERGEGIRGENEGRVSLIYPPGMP